MRTAIAAAALLAVSAGTPRAQDVETGKASFRKCVLCHSIGENAKNKVGPELNGLDGCSAGAVQASISPQRPVPEWSAMRALRKSSLAMQHLTKAKQIFSQLGQTPNLALVNAALTELG